MKNWNKLTPFLCLHCPRVANFLLASFLLCKHPKRIQNCDQSSRVSDLRCFWFVEVLAGSVLKCFRLTVSYQSSCCLGSWRAIDLKLANQFLAFVSLLWTTMISSFCCCLPENELGRYSSVEFWEIAPLRLVSGQACLGTHCCAFGWIPFSG